MANHQLHEWFYALITNMGFSAKTAEVLDGWLVILSIVLIILAINFFMRLGVVRFIRWFVSHTKVTWDNVIFDAKVMRRLCNIIMPIVVKIALPTVVIAMDIAGKSLEHILYIAVDLWIVFTGLLFVHSILKAIYEIFEQRPGLHGKPIKGLLQTCQVLLIVIGLILAISILLDTSPTLLLTGLGASAAVISFIFKDSLMGLVAGVQLSLNNMLKVGDWIEMPSRGIDGVVVEVTLTTVKVRAWNNTLQTIPPYVLISEPFDNWQAMRDSGGRRIKRSLNIDITSIGFADEAMIASLRNNECTRELINNIATQTVEGAQLTNVDLFIRCINRYIDIHPRVNHTMLAMVRQLQPTQWGLPIELYFFTSDVNWVPHEHLQTEVMSHVLALAPLFGIRIYQAPTTVDVRR
ncbi:MAG: mechanosensitive ion channel [Alistipes sp.]|nr:mechanosensitive ion channel [Alistipes sp.]